MTLNNLKFNSPPDNVFLTQQLRPFIICTCTWKYYSLVHCRLPFISPPYVELELVFLVFYVKKVFFFFNYYKILSLGQKICKKKRYLNPMVN